MASLLSMMRNRFFSGSNGSESVTGTDQFDVMLGLGGADTLDGGAGNDVVYGGDGDDRLIGGAGNDWVFGDNGADTIFGDSVDTSFSGGGDDRLYGGEGDDIISGGMGSNFIDGGGGNDTLHATWAGFAISELGGPATIDGGSGNDAIFGTFATDTLRGGTGNDTIFGFEGNDLIQGGDGNDELVWGTSFAPVGLGTLEGGNGNDVLRCGLVTCTMSGGADDDTLILGRFNPGSTGAAPPVIDGGTGFDTLNVGTRPVFDLTGNDAVNLSGIEEIDLVEASPGNQLILDMASLLNLSNDTDTLFVAGGSLDKVTAEGAWLASGQQTIDGILYNQWTSGTASLLVDSDVAVTVV